MQNMGSIETSEEHQGIKHIRFCFDYCVIRGDSPNELRQLAARLVNQSKRAYQPMLKQIAKRLPEDKAIEAIHKLIAG